MRHSPAAKAKFVFEPRAQVVQICPVSGALYSSVCPDKAAQRELSRQQALAPKPQQNARLNMGRKDNPLNHIRTANTVKTQVKLNFLNRSTDF